MSWNETSQATLPVSDERVSAFLSKVYGWMFGGLLITAVIAFTVASTPALIETLLEKRRFRGNNEQRPSLSAYELPACVPTPSHERGYGGG